MMAVTVRTISIENMRKAWAEVEQQMVYEGGITMHLFTHPLSKTKHIFEVSKRAVKHIRFDGDIIESVQIAYRK